MKPNAVLPFGPAELRDVQETVGITQFPSEFAWNHLIGGLQLQGGKESVTSSSTKVVNLSAPYSTQLFGVFIQVIGAAENGAYVNAVDLDSFEIVNGAGDRTYYWWSIGV